MALEISQDVWKHSQHGGNTLIVLLKLADNASAETREAYPSVGYLAELSRTSRRTVQRALRDLEGISGDKPPEIVAVGPSKLKDGHNWATTYKIITGTPEYERRRGEWEAARGGGDNLTPPVDDGAPTPDLTPASGATEGGVTRDAGGASTVTPQPSEEPSEEPSADRPPACAHEGLEPIHVPSELGAAFAEVSTILDRVAAARGVERPSRESLARAMIRRVDREPDMARTAEALEHWACHGNGRRRQVKDVLARWRDWLDRDGPTQQRGSTPLALVGGGRRPTAEDERQARQRARLERIAAARAAEAS